MEQADDRAQHPLGTVLTTLPGLDTRLAVSYLNCPRCGLTIKLRTSWLTIRHCPRCVARSRTVIELFGSALPADPVYTANARPHAGAIGRAATSRSTHSTASSAFTTSARPTLKGSCRRGDPDKHLKNQGRVDQVKGSTKNAVDKVEETQIRGQETP
jgi:hypothetical protein